MSRIANRPLTKPRDPRRYADLAQVIAATGLLIIPAFLYASQRARLLDARQRVSALEAQLLAEAERRELLEVQLAAEHDPRRIRDKALTLAGLGDADPDQVSYLSRAPVSAGSFTAVGLSADGHP